MRKKTKSIPQRPVVVEPPEEKEPLPEVPWKQRHHYGCQHLSLSVDQIVSGAMAGEFRLPKFQRPFVWTDAEVLYLLDSLMRGYHVGTVFLWRRYRMPATVTSFGGVEVTCPAGESHLVIDGQQRIGSVVRAFCSGRFAFHLLEGTFHVDAGEAPWLVPLASLWDTIGVRFEGAVPLWDWALSHAQRHGLKEREVRLLACSAVDPVVRGKVSATYVDHHTTRAEVVESFRRMNTAGRPFDATELSDAMKRAEEEGDSDTGDR